MRLFRVELGGFKPWMWADHGDLSPMLNGWVQQDQHWTLFFFEHDGVLVIDNQAHAYTDGMIGFVPPGAKAEFRKTGPGTLCYSLTFEIVPRTEVVAIPAVASLGHLSEVRRQEFEEAMKWLQVTIMRGLAVAYNVLWSVALPASEFRKSSIVEQAEDYISRHISKPIRVADIAKELGFSQSQLLRGFQEEHKCTVQQFIRQRRGELARHLILRSSLPLKEVAAKTGMPDLHYFNKVVRLTAGMSPRELRRLSEHKTLH